MDNLSHAEIPGYKKSEAITQGFPLELEAEIHKLGAMKPQTEGTYYSTNLPGTLIKTGNPTDLALGEEGFFVVVGPWGEGYTRDGRFILDKDGHLVSVAGNYPVMGNGGPIVVAPGAKIDITQQGEIKVDNVVVDKIQVVNPKNTTNMESINGSIFKKSDAFMEVTEVQNPRVIQGYIESSNVDMMSEIMEMIYLERTYNLNTKIISSRDGNLARAMDLGKPTQ